VVILQALCSAWAQEDVRQVCALLASWLHFFVMPNTYQRLRELVYALEHTDPDYVLSKLGQVSFVVNKHW
jgi:hypothetical protein